MRAELEQFADFDKADAEYCERLIGLPSVPRPFDSMADSAHLLNALSAAFCCLPECARPVK